MKYLKLFESFIEEDILDDGASRDVLHNMCERYDIKNYTINEDESIDVDEHVNLDRKYLTKLPIKFRNVTRYFFCTNNQLTTLEGCPKSVRGDFFCYYNNLTSLKGCPESVGGDFNCSNNKIITFEHLPLSIGGVFNCFCNPIYEIWDLFEDYSKIEFLNDCDAIREPNIIILDRLNYFLEEIGKKPVKRVEGYKCI